MRRNVIPACPIDARPALRTCADVPATFAERTLSYGRDVWKLPRARACYCYRNARDRCASSLLSMCEQFGLWLSLVERCVRDAEAVGSNPTSPTPRASLRRHESSHSHHHRAHGLWRGVFSCGNSHSLVAFCAHVSRSGMECIQNNRRHCSRWNRACYRDRGPWFGDYVIRFGTE